MKKLNHLLLIVLTGTLLAACNEENTEETVNKNSEQAEAQEDENKQTASDADSNNETTESDSVSTIELKYKPTPVTDDDLLAEAIAKNPLSEEVIERAATELVKFIQNLYGMDKSLTTKEAIVSYLAENTLLSKSKIENDYAEYFTSMNVPDERAEMIFQVEKADQISIDGIEVKFRADITFYNTETNEKIDSITRFHNVFIGQDKENKDKFSIISLVIND